MATMTTITISSQEMGALKHITKPSSYGRLYTKLNEIDDMDSKLSEYLSKKNYTMVDEIYESKGIIKQTIVKNQLTLLRIYQHLIISKKNKNNEYVLTIQDTLVPLLIDTISRATEKIKKKKERKKASHFDNNIEPLFSEILTKIENSTEGYRIYMANKELNNIKDIIDYNDYHKEDE